jgi:hypothetical protein
MRSFRREWVGEPRGCCTVRDDENLSLSGATAEMMLCTWNFNVHANTPVCGAFGAVDIQVSQAHFLHGRNDLRGFVVTRHANLLSIPRVL